MGHIWFIVRFYSPLLSSWQCWQDNVIAATVDVRLWGTGKGDEIKWKVKVKAVRTGSVAGSFEQGCVL